MHQIEVEIKTLLGSAENAKKFVSRLYEIDPETQLVDQNSQLNHYFVDGDINKLAEKSKDFLTDSEYQNFVELIKISSNYSLKTREVDQTKVFLTVKVTVDNTSNDFGTARKEFETEVDLSLADLEKILLECGFEYQAKWSRSRDEYKFLDTNVTIDKNAGWGYIAEIEQIVQENQDVDKVKKYLREQMTKIGFEEVKQDRLARMLDFYNKNWRDYYGSEEFFVLE